MKYCLLFVAALLPWLPPLIAAPLSLKVDLQAGKASVSRENGTEPILIQNAREDFRPYIHPLVAPDGDGVLTEFSPDHHPHQTGLFWGFTRLNDRDYFHHPEGTHWRRAALEAIDTQGESVSWKTSYDLLDGDGTPVLRETQTWTFRDNGDHYVMDLEWQGEAKRDVTVGKSDYGGLFLRMPWQEGMPAEVVNAARERDSRAEGRRALWLDVGLQVEGRKDLAHIAIFDHSDNAGFPQPWRVDSQFGVGPVRARLGDWNIDAGETETIKHRFIVYTGELDDVSLTEQWGQFSEQGGTYALWGLAQQEGRTAEFLTPERAVESMTIPEGYEVNVFASEPMMTQPMAFCWDDRGRLWIAENRDYESRGSGFSNFGDSRVSILEDTDGDGMADTKKVFLEGIPFPAGIAVGFDGLWLGAPPNLLFVPDRDGDDKADMDDIEVRLTGWGIRDRHETLNSFHWGPDGWLYGCQGYATPSVVRKPEGKGRIYKPGEPFPEDLLQAEGVDINGGIWRYHPIKDVFEVVAHGFSNPWGIDYDAKGQIFITACVIPHLWHVIPGGIYHRQGGKHFNPYVYADIRTIADHRHRSAHGGARIYLSDAFPKDQHGKIFMANIHEHAVLSDVLEPSGSGFIGRHGDDFILANNAQWIGFSMELGPEGALYVLDWHDADICGKEVLNKDTGRVFRITPKESLAEEWDGRYADLAEFDDVSLAEMQLSESSWHARRARVILQHRAAQGVLAPEAHVRLRSILDSHANMDWRLRALWALHITNGLQESDLLDTLNDDDAHLRAWSIQLLCEDKQTSKDAVTRFASMAETDPSPVVRLYLAAALQRLPHEDRWAVAKALLQREEDENDHSIPKMIWFGVEPLVPEAPRHAVELAFQSRLNLVTKFIARRLADAGELDVLVEGMASAAPNGPLLEILRGMQDGLEGRTDVDAPSGWNGIYPTLQSHGNPEVSRIAVALAQQFGDTAAAEELLSRVKDKDAPTAQRVEALNNLADQQHPELAEVLLTLLDDEAMRLPVIRAMAAFENEALSQALLDRFENFSAAERLEAVQTLASRPKYGWALTQAIKRGDVARRDVPAYVARQLRRVVGNGFVEIWGPIDALSSDKAAAYEKYRSLLSDDAIATADVHQGRAIFERTCSACHKMYGDGGDIGPDITGSNRGNLDYLLSNILDPSEEIPEGYQMALITTRDGRTYSGNIANEDERQVTLRIVGQEPVVIAKSAIQSREVVPVSMMPEGLLGTLSDVEVLQLAAYLRTSEQVSLPNQ